MPAGAIPKDGPSAGVTMATAIASLVTGTPVNSEVAMTGEVTLTGQVLPIGGLKEKTLAAQRAGITTVILPSRNEADLEDVPEELRKGMTFVPVDRVEQVWEAAMGLRLDGKTRRAGRGQRAARGGRRAARSGRGARPAARRRRGRREPGRRSAGREEAGAKKPPAKKPAARKAAARKPARKAPAKPAAKPKAPPPKAKGGAKKTTAARGRSGRKR